MAHDRAASFVSELSEVAPQVLVEFGCSPERVGWDVECLGGAFEEARHDVVGCLQLHGCHLGSPFGDLRSRVGI